jgi:hypothetical protein
MKTTKMSLANIQGKLSRTEMKSIMAGSGGSPGCHEGTACGAHGNGTCGTTSSGCACSNYPEDTSC